MASGPLELALDDHDFLEPPREPPPSQAAKLRALDQLDFRMDTLARIRDFAPVIVALSGAVALVLAVTLWTRSR